MKTAGDFTPERHALTAALAGLDAHWNQQALTVDFAGRLLWHVRQVHTAWMAASGGTGEIPGVTLAGMSERLTGAMMQGGLLSLTTVALAMGEMKFQSPKSKIQSEEADAGEEVAS